MILSSGIGTILQNFILNFSGEFELSIIGNPKHLLPFLTDKTNYSIIESDLPIYSIKEQIKLPGLIPSCDIFWSPHYNIPLFPIKAKKRVVNINDVFHLAFKHTTTLSQKLYANLVINQAIIRSDRVITISKFSESEIKKHTFSKKNKFEIIYCGVDHNLFQKIDDSQKLEAAKRKYQLPPKYILCVGNVKPHKNLKVLMNALSSLKDNLQDYEIVIVGKQQGFITGDPLLFKKIQEDPFLSAKTKFTGFVPNEDLPCIYNLASLFIFPSFYEGFGLPPLEAMACGCPVLVSHAASMPEICEDAARYFNPLNEEDMAAKILDALTTESNTYIAKGLNHSKKFTWQKYYSTQKSIFQNLIECN